jgi:hypothetical protein
MAFFKDFLQFQPGFNWEFLGVLLPRARRRRRRRLMMSRLLLTRLSIDSFPPPSFFLFGRGRVIITIITLPGSKKRTREATRHPLITRILTCRKPIMRAYGRDDSRPKQEVSMCSAAGAKLPHNTTISPKTAAATGLHADVSHVSHLFPKNSKKKPKCFLQHRVLYRLLRMSRYQHHLSQSASECPGSRSAVAAGRQLPRTSYRLLLPFTAFIQLGTRRSTFGISQIYPYPLRCSHAGFLSGFQ